MSQQDRFKELPSSHDKSATSSRPAQRDMSLTCGMCGEHVADKLCSQCLYDSIETKVVDLVESGKLDTYLESRMEAILTRRVAHGSVPSMEQEDHSLVDDISREKVGP